MKGVNYVYGGLSRVSAVAGYNIMSWNVAVDGRDILPINPEQDMSSTASPLLSRKPHISSILDPNITWGCYLMILRPNR